MSFLMVERCPKIQVFLGFQLLQFVNPQRNESLEAGYCPITGLYKEDVLKAVKLVVEDPIDYKLSPAPEAYTQREVSKIVRIVLGMGRVIDEQVWGPADKKFV